eukprot:m.124516 g.124516  ORF g.124516 m.124516 type:complete len:601 (+) comp15709_c0_seq5:29-1831(+)
MASESFSPANLAAVAQQTTSFILGVTIASLIASLLVTNYMVWHSYLQVVFWSFLMAQALRPFKQYLVSNIKLFRQDGVDPAKRVPLLKHIWEVNVTRYNEAKQSHNIAKTIVAQSFAQFSLLLLVTAFINVLGLVGFLTLVVAIVLLIIVAAFLMDYHLLQLHNLMGLDDNTVVTLALNFGMSFMCCFVVVYLGIQTVLEGVGAVEETYSWVQSYIDSTSRSGEDMAAIQGYAEQGYEQIQAQFNTSEWWPAAERIEVAVRNNSNITEAVLDSRTILGQLYNESTWWPMVDRVVDASIVTPNDPSKAASAGMSFIDFELLQEMVMGAMAALQDPVGLVLKGLLYVLSVLASVGAASSQLIAFFIFFFEQTAASVDPLESLIRVIIPAAGKRRRKILSNVQQAITASFQIPLAIASLHSMVTLVVYTVLGVRARYFATFLSFFLSLTYLVDPMAVHVVWMLTLVAPSLIGTFSIVSVVKGVLLLVIHVIAYARADNLVFALGKTKSVSSNPGLTLFAVVLGFYTFGAKGLVIGPLSLYLLLTIYHLRLNASYKADDKPDDSDVSDSEEEEESNATTSQAAATTDIAPSQQRTASVAQSARF